MVYDQIVWITNLEIYFEFKNISHNFLHSFLQGYPKCLHCSTLFDNRAKRLVTANTKLILD